MGRYAPMTELKKRRKALGLNQTQLAERAGVCQTAISQYEICSIYLTKRR